MRRFGVQLICSSVRNRVGLHAPADVVHQLGEGTLRVQREEGETKRDTLESKRQRDCCQTEGSAKGNRCNYEEGTEGSGVTENAKPWSC